jgi:hypothetical protein
MKAVEKGGAKPSNVVREISHLFETAGALSGTFPIGGIQGYHYRNSNVFLSTCLLVANCWLGYSF